MDRSLNVYQQSPAVAARVRHTTVALYRSFADAGSAVTKLHNMGLPLEMLSLVDKDRPAGFSAAGPLAHVSGAVALPEPRGQASPDTAALNAAAAPLGRADNDNIADDSSDNVADRPAGSPGVLADRLVGLGISREEALAYEANVRDGVIMLVVHGSLTDTGRAAALLDRTLHCGLEEYEA